MALEIVSLHNHGNADKEYVFLRTTAKVNLHNYILFDNTYNRKKDLSNIHRHMYWFPKVNIESGFHIYLFTRTGENHFRKDKNILNLFWNSEDSIWNDDKDTAYLIKMHLVDSKSQVDK